MERGQENPAIDKFTQEAIDRIEGLRESEVPSAISPDEGRVLDERQDPTHSLREGRIRTAFKLSGAIDPKEPVKDLDLFKSVSTRD